MKNPFSHFVRWVDRRLPIFKSTSHFLSFPTPSNLNYWWTFGAILTVCLLSQIVTGIILAMHYTPHVQEAFSSIQRIKREVPFGWIIQPWHAVGASMFFIAVYLHMLRALYYGSYKSPREIIWLIGCVIYFLMMATAFMGYVLPFGQMSLWGAQVITNFFTAIPWIGDDIRTLLLGSFTVSNATLNRFFALHYFLPFVICVFVGLHVWAIHVVGNNNPLGIDFKKSESYVSFHPYYTVKDFFAVSVFFCLFSFMSFFAPDYLGHPDNYIKANYLKTPDHIVPEWYFLIFYAILRAVPSKGLGVFLMFLSILVLFLLPWLDKSNIRSMKFRPITKYFFCLFVFFCLMLGICGANQPDDVVPFLGVTYLFLGRISTIYYFLYFFVILPFVPIFEKDKMNDNNIFLKK